MLGKCFLTTNSEKYHCLQITYIPVNYILFSFLQPKKKTCEDTKTSLMKFVDISVQVVQLSVFISTFSIITHYIVNTEFHESKVQNFILPAIISVFIWMMSISYLLLSLVLDESRKPEARLVFKDYPEDLEAAKNQLRYSLRRRLHDMDRK